MTSAPRARALFKLIVAAGLLIAFGSPGNGRPEGATPDRIVEITAKKWEFAPATITLRKGVPVVLQLTSADRHHGFSVPALGLRADIAPGSPTRIRVTPTSTGSFAFHCDVFCGEGHEEMTGQLVVVP